LKTPSQTNRAVVKLVGKGSAGVSPTHYSVWRGGCTIPNICPWVFIYLFIYFRVGKQQMQPKKPLKPHVKLIGRRMAGVSAAHHRVGTQDLPLVPGSQKALYQPAITPWVTSP
jgi:hypothetical protein